MAVMDIIIRAQDRASKVVEQFGSKAEAAISKAEGGFKRAGGAMQNFGKKATFMATLPIAAGFAKAAGAAESLGESVNAVNQVFGEASGIIHDYAETSATSVGLSADAFNSLAVPVGAMLQNVGFGADEAADSTINLAERAADMASVFNVDVDEAMMAIQAGLRGQADPLEKFGVGMSAAAVEAHALETGLWDGSEAMDDNAKMQARLSLLMSQTDKISGDFANTSESTANAQRIEKARAEDLAATMGESLLPVKSKMIEVAGKLIDKFTGMSSGMQTGVIAGLGLVAALGPLMTIMGTISKIVGTSIGLFAKLFITKNADTGATIAQTIATNAMAAAKWLAATAARGLGIAMRFALGPIGLIIAAIAAAIAIGILIYKNWDTISAFLIAIWTKIKDVAVAVWTAITEFFSAKWTEIKAEIFAAWTAVTAFLRTVWDSIKKVAMAVFNAIKTYFTTVFNFYKTLIEKVWNGIKQFLSTLWNGIKAVATTIFDALKAFFQSQLDHIKANFERIWNGLKLFLSTIWNGIKVLASTVWDGIKKLIINPIVAVKDMIINSFTTVRDTLAGIWDSVSGKISSTFGGMAGLVKGPINAVIGLINGFINRVNGISISIPDIPGIPGRGTNVGFSIPNIPRLAKGGMFIAGEAGPESVRVAPLSKDPLLGELRSLRSEMSRLFSGTVSLPIEIHIDGEVRRTSIDFSMSDLRKTARAH